MKPVYASVLSCFCSNSSAQIILFKGEKTSKYVCDADSDYLAIKERFVIKPKRVKDVMILLSLLQFDFQVRMKILN